MDDAVATEERRGAGDVVQLRELWRMLRRRRVLVLGCTTAVFAAGSVVTVRTAPVYQAATSVRIDETRGLLSGPDAGRLAGERTRIATDIDALRSRTLIEEVVDSLALQVQLTRPSRVRRSSVISAAKVARTAAPGDYTFVRRRGGDFAVVDARTRASVGAVKAGGAISLRGATVTLAPEAAEHAAFDLQVASFNDAVALVRRTLMVLQPNSESNLVVVRYEGGDPEIVRDVPNVVAARFVTQRSDAQKRESRSTVKFLREQLDTVAAQLATSERELRSFRETQQVVNLEAEATAQVGRLAQLQSERATIDAERSALTRLLDEVNAAASSERAAGRSPYRRLIAFPTLLRNGAASEMLAALAKAENDRAELLARRTPEDPDVQALTARVEATEERLRSVASTYRQGLENQVVALDAALFTFGRQLARVPAKEIEFARRQRRPKVLEAIFTLLQTRLKEAEITQAIDDATVRLVDPAVLPEAPVRPRVPLNAALSAIVGLMVGGVAAYARDRLDRSVRTRADVEDATGLPVLGVIPRIQSATRSSVAALSGGGGTRSRAQRLRSVLDHGPKSLGTRAAATAVEVDHAGGSANAIARRAAVEAYRTLRTNILFSRPTGGSALLVVTSPMMGEGKSTTATNLAVVLAHQGLNVLLMDADVRLGVLNDVLNVSREPGLSNVLNGEISLERALQRCGVGGAAELDFLSTGTRPHNPAELIGSPRMKALIDSLSTRYDAIVADVPPLMGVSDAAVLGRYATGVLIVARAGVTTPEMLRYAVDQLRAVGAPVIGAVLNAFDAKRHGGSYGYDAAVEQYYAQTPVRI